MKRLDAATIRSLKPDPAKRLEIPDLGDRGTPDDKDRKGVRGLYLIIQPMPSGKTSWVVRYRNKDGKRRKYTIGSHSVWSIKNAREKAREILLEVEKGEDPALKPATPAIERGNVLYVNVLDEFFKRHVDKKTKPSTALTTKDRFKNHVTPVWKDRKISEIEHADIVSLQQSIADDGKGTTANRTMEVISKFLNWCVQKNYITESPFYNIAKEPTYSRERVLDENEIRWFWQATGNLDYPFGPCFRLLLLTGQRLGEVSGASEGELNFALTDLSKGNPKEACWTIPGRRTKNGNKHEVQLSDAALDVLGEIPLLNHNSGLLFSTNDRTPISGFSNAKKKIDRLMLDIAREETEALGQSPDKVQIEPWRLHDLRRTVATGLQEIGIDMPVTEKILNHSSGSFGGIAGVYQRYKYEDERRAALQAWGRRVLAIAGEERGDNVIQLMG